jgi:hypothetical protein
MKFRSVLDRCGYKLHSIDTFRIRSLLRSYGNKSNEPLDGDELLAIRIANSSDRNGNGNLWVQLHKITIKSYINK